LSRLLAALPLLAVLALPVSGAGCCADVIPSTLPPPVLPAGKPDGWVEKELALKDEGGLWLDDTPAPGLTSLPSGDLVDLIAVKESWKAWALALVAAGRWRE